MLGYWLGAVVAGVLSAALYLSVVVAPGGVALATFTQMPLFLIGLGYGLPAVIAAAVAGTVAVLTAMGMMASLLYGLVDAAPVVVLVERALLSRRGPDGSSQWYPCGLLVAWLTALALALVTLFLVMLAGRDGGIAGTIRQQIDLMMPMFGPQAETARLVFDAVLPAFPGLIVGAWVAVTAMNGALGQALLAGRRRALRPAPDLASAELPRWIAAALAAALAMAVLGRGTPALIGTNLTVVLTLPYLFLGLAVVHALTLGVRGRMLLLSALYAMMAILGWPVLAIACLGFVEQWFGLRRRWAAPGREV